MAKDCNPPNDIRFEQTKPPEDFCDPTEGQTIGLSKSKLEETTLDRITDSVLPDCEPLDKRINGPSTEDRGLGADSPEGPFLIGLNELSELCRRDMGPHLITGILLQMITRHFLSKDNIFNREIRNLVWSPDPKINKIRIGALHSWSPQDANQKPAILFKRAEMKFNRIVIGDRDASYRDSNEAYYSRMVTGGHEILCLGGTNFETEILGFEVAQFFTTFSRAIHRIVPIFDLQVANLSEIHPIEDMNNLLGISVSITYNYPWTWSLQPQGPILKSVTLKV